MYVCLIKPHAMNIITGAVACILNSEQMHGAELEFSLGKEISSIYWKRWLVASTAGLDTVRERKCLYVPQTEHLVSCQ
jgi:hypothetical protein